MKTMDEKYQLEDQLLGEGKFGSVQLAKSKLETSLKICVKIMKKKKNFGECVLKTIQESEFNICKKMINKKHNNLVQIYDVYDSDLEDENAYIFMERCDLSLKELISKKKNEEKKQFSKEELIDIIKQIAQGYNQMISEQIIHRDLKPENILCNIKDNQLTIKIADFGLSKIIDPHSNQNMTKKVGTKYYCAPEILKDENFINYNNLCDIFSLGVIIFELALLQRQFICKSVEQLKDMTFSQLHKNVLNTYPIDQDILELLDKMIAYNPQNRLTWEQLLNYFDKETKQNYIDNQPKQNSSEIPFRYQTQPTNRSESKFLLSAAEQPKSIQPTFQKTTPSLIFQQPTPEQPKFSQPTSQKVPLPQPLFSHPTFNQPTSLPLKFNQPTIQPHTSQQPALQFPSFNQISSQKTIPQYPIGQFQPIPSSLTFQQPMSSQQNCNNPAFQYKPQFQLNKQQ